MKKLTVLLATLFVFFSADAQQILSGIYSGSMYNDSTKMLQKYELALSEYRGKVMGYSYVTFIVNDTFYYGIRRVKGYKNDNNELVLTDEELLANNFPESPAKRVKRTAVFPLAQEDTITSLSGTWQTNSTRRYYSVGGATKTERSVDSAQSPLVAHLKELKVISDKPNYQDDPVVKSKKKEDKPKKDDKEPNETGIARSDSRKSEKEKTGENQPDAKTPVADKATAALTTSPSRHTNKDNKAVAATTPKEPATDSKGSVAVSTGVSSNSTAANNTQPAADKKPVTTDKATPQATADPRKEGAAVVIKAGDKPAANTSHPTANTDNNTIVDPTTGDLITRKPTPAKPAVVTSQPAPNTSTPVSGLDIAKTTDKKAEGMKEVAAKPADQKNDAVAAGTTQPATGNNTAAGTTGKKEDKATAVSSGVAPNEKAPAAVAAVALDTRTSAVIKTLEVVNDSITLSFYDNGVVDGDVISVFVNGENVIASQKLNEVAIKKTVHLTNFASDSVEVTLVAETLGSIPPNTGLLLVRDGDTRYDVRFSADMKTNASIIFRKRKQ